MTFGHTSDGNNKRKNVLSRTKFNRRHLRWKY